MNQFSNSKGVGLIQASSYNVHPRKWNILREDVSLPAACINRTKLENNLRWMDEFVSHYPTAKLVPHGKSTMCPQLFHMQLQQENTWGITVATAHQVQVAANHGVKNVVLANQLIGRSNMEMVANVMKLDPAFRFVCIVDSVENIRALGTFFEKQDCKLEVLIEIGTPEHGRTGLRLECPTFSVLNELKRWKNTIQLVGIEFYEGTLKSAESVGEFIRSQVTQFLSVLIAQDESLFANDEIILSGAGSAYFDVVAEELSKVNLPAEFLRRAKRNHRLAIHLRAGCYITQDVGVYQAAQDRMKATDAVVRGMQTSLVPAMQIWAYVQSKPEPGLAIIGMGRRDVAFDSGMPEPSVLCRHATGQLVNVTNKGWVVTNLMDQHAFMKIDTSTGFGQVDFDDLSIGDMIGFEIRHPCTTFDKWRSILLVDDQYNVLDIFETYF